MQKPKGSTHLASLVRVWNSLSVADPRRRPKGAMAPLRVETAIKKAQILLLYGAKIIDFVFI